MAERFDGIIIGTGQAGKPLGGALAAAGWRVAIVERGRIGGTCVIDGCTPTKTMIASARVAYLARRSADFGVRTGHVSVDLDAVRARKRGVVESFSQGSERGMRRREGLELILGEARFVGREEIEVELSDGGARRLSARKIFINAGARPAVPSIPGLADVSYLDSTSILELGELPEHLLVLGGGFIGLEFAQMFRRFGSEVSIVEMGAQIAGREDRDVAEALEQILTDDGISILTDAQAQTVRRGPDGGIMLQVKTPAGEREIAGSHLLVSTGRTPNTDALNLAAAGVKTTAGGFIEVNERLETSAPGIYALGDIAGSPPFTHIAYDDFRILSSRLLEGGERTTADRMVPYVVFTDPQFGRVGLSESEAREEGREVHVAKLPMTRVARAIEMDETRGFMKALVDPDTRRILGAAILGVEGGEVLSVLQTAMMGDLPYTAVRDGIYGHPTLSESLNNLFMTLDG